jgi:hypothetical protein
MDRDEPVGAGASHTQPEALVGLLEHQHVGTGRRADDVTPHLVRAPRVVGYEVEERARVLEPGRAVGRTVGDLLEHPAGGQVAHAQAQHLSPVEVHADHGQPMVGADGEHAETEVGVLADLDVAVDHHDLVGRRCGRVDRQPPGVGQVRRVGRASGRRTAAVQRVGHPLDGAAVVEPALVEHRHRGVRLDDATLDPLEQRGDQPVERCEVRRRVGVLRLEVRAHRRVLALPQPVERVVDDRAVRTGQRMRATLRARRDGGIGTGQGHRGSGRAARHGGSGAIARGYGERRDRRPQVAGAAYGWRAEPLRWTPAPGTGGRRGDRPVI